MTPQFPRLRKAYLLGNGLAVAITLLAGIINLIVGPRNPIVFVFVLFELFFAWITLILLDAVNRPVVDRWWPFWWRGRATRKFVTQLFDWNNRIVSLSFLCFTPAFFLLVSIVLFYAAVTGTIDPIRTE
jgi:hypothetical protein